MAASALAAVLADPIVKIIDELFDSPTERAEAKLKLLSMEMAPYLAQLEVNKEEAKNINVFVAGWRPFIGWTCGAIFGWNFIAAPLVHWLVILAGASIPPIPTLGLAEVMPVLLGLLGLGSMRTYEKTKGVEGNR